MIGLFTIFYSHEFVKGFHLLNISDSDGLLDRSLLGFNYNDAFNKYTFQFLFINF
jgi:hypothetical protein